MLALQPWGLSGAVGAGKDKKDLKRSLQTNKFLSLRRTYESEQRLLPLPLPPGMPR